GRVNPRLEAARACGAAGTLRPVVPPCLEREMRGQDMRRSQKGAHTARCTGTAGLLMVILPGLWASPCPTWAGAARRDRAVGAAVPFPPLHWKGRLLAGADSIGAFDHAITALATRLAHHNIPLVRLCSPHPTNLPP